MNCRGGYVLEVDIRKFFDNLDHGHLRTFLQLRVRDGVLLRLIGKWLKAGVMEDGCVSYPDSGSPQGGVVSPLLSNIFLHYVLDLWFEREVKLQSFFSMAIAPNTFLREVPLTLSVRGSAWSWQMLIYLVRIPHRKGHSIQRVVLAG
jgi:retron-type reverse transcriptase